MKSRCLSAGSIRWWLIGVYLVVQSAVLIRFHGASREDGAADSAWWKDTAASVDTIEDAKAYVNSFKSLDRHLILFHIPKTAGTAFENGAAEQQVHWGSCLFRHKPKRDICNYPGEHDWPKNVGWWHLPPQVFPLADSDPYQNAELFGVVRDPYDRMVSEFYYICSLKIKDWRPDQCDNRTRLGDPLYMNEWLQRKLRSERTYLTDNGHFTPQYEFVVGPQQVRMLDYVLTLDKSLDGNFDRLKRAFGLDDVQLEQMNAIGAESRKETAKLGVPDLDATTMQLIHENYQDDFGNFGFAKKSIAR